MRKPLIYLASPYSKRPLEYFIAVCRKAAEMTRYGLLVFSPIAHTHPIHLFGIPGGFDQWREYDERMLSLCDKLVVLTLDGWDTSVGVTYKIALAKKLNLPIIYLTP